MWFIYRLGIEVGDSFYWKWSFKLEEINRLLAAAKAIHKLMEIKKREEKLDNYMLHLVHA